MRNQYDKLNMSDIGIIIMSVIGIPLIVYIILFGGTMTNHKYVQTVINDEQYVIENTATPQGSDYFIIDPDGTTYSLKIDFEGRAFPKEKHYTHEITEIDESNEIMIKMRDASMHNQNK